MRRILLMLVLILCCVSTVYATEYSAPEAPQSAEKYIQEGDSFGQDLWFVVKTALQDLQPAITNAAGICLSIIAVVLLVSILQNFPGVPTKTCELISSVSIGVLLLQPVDILLRLGTQTIQEMSDYGKLLLPVMTASLAAQGGSSSSAALNVGTVFFDSVLSSLIANILVPLVYVYVCLSIAKSAIKESTLGNIQSFIKWLITWSLKIVLYVFTGYMSITNVISGTADATVLKATKLTISGAVPVVGNILSDASETILVSAGVMKNAAGVYGLIVIFALFVGPFFEIGIQYLLLKVTAGICSVFGSKNSADLVNDFSGAMGIVLAMTGAICLLLLISTVCFMKGFT